MKHIARESRVYELPYIAEPVRGIGQHLDLRRDPAQISIIPELRDQPVLRSLVEELNAKHGPFMTHGCAFALARPQPHIPVSKESEVARHWCTSYVTFSFWRFSGNDERAYQSLFEKYPPWSGSGAEVCFEIQPAYFLSAFEQRVSRKWGERNATVCVLWVSGWGEADRVAYSRWRNTINDVISFFGTFKRDDNQMKFDGITVSELMLNTDPSAPEWATRPPSD